MRREEKNCILTFPVSALGSVSVLVVQLQRQDEDHQLRQKTLANPDKNHFLAKARRNSFLTTMPISSTFWCHKRNEINIRQTLGIDIRKEPSRNETTRLDEIREGHRKEIRTIQPTLDTWTA
ncbi:hypothetical protein HGM15179_014359 [Zosterops borbonicus]|uniref:Uncharacterized protein n=1 Tax=Zosterops borbonicus TaxID=364589 RepID=A0A8K1LG98_9PASS|nr:hypothetical protein HGM15179_014359 [Zosterops borbonicus]